MGMKNWWVTVFEGNYKTVFQKQCLTAKEATDWLVEAKKQYVNDLKNPAAPRYTHHREWY